MTSSDYLSSNTLHSHLNSNSCLNLSMASVHNTADELKKTSSSTTTIATTPSSSSPRLFYTPAPNIPNQTSFPPANLFRFPRPPGAPTLMRRNIEFKPPEQDVLDKNFIQTFALQNTQKENSSTTRKTFSLLNKTTFIICFCLFLRNKLYIEEIRYR